MKAKDIQKRRIASFRQLAGEELAASVALAAGNRRQSVYLLQQAVEKMVRGVLESHSIPAGATHNIRALADLLPPGHALIERFKTFDELTPAATRYRYPTSEGHILDISEDRLKRLIEAVKALQLEIDPLLAQAIAELE